MLSYLHSFHAGNRADLHKHGGLLALLAAMRKDPEPITYIETHSGRGRYDLHAAQAKKTGEFLTGAATLWQAKPPPRGLAPLAQAIQAENEDRDDLRYYPGSPMLAAKALRQRDRLELCELHPKEAPALRQALARFRRAKIRYVDGLEWVKSAPGLQGRRTLILIDPSYEQAAEYEALGAWLPEMSARLPSASFCLWLPLLPDARHLPMLEALKSQPQSANDAGVSHLVGERESGSWPDWLCACCRARARWNGWRVGPGAARFAEIAESAR